MAAGVKKIVSTILSEAESRAEEIIKDAEKKKDKIIKEGKEKAKKVKEETLRRLKKEGRMKYRQIISNAKIKARRSELKTREKLIEKSFKIAENKLKEMASKHSEKYKQALINLIERSITEIGGGELQLHLNSRDTEFIKDQIEDISNKVSEKIGKNVKLELGEEINTIGGVIVRTKDGSIEVNNTLEARLSRLKKVLRPEVADILFK